MARTAELLLGPEPDAIPRARRFTRSFVASGPREDDAELVVAELVTNATLHGRPPIRLRLASDETALRIEVQDVGHEIPLQLRQSPDSMTGRGLALVAAVSSGWGVEAGEAGGKTVWAQLSYADAPGTDDFLEPELDPEALLAAYDDDEIRYDVVLGAVPTALLLDAKAHIDNVVRELTLMRNEQVTSGVALPDAVVELIRSVTEDFADARAGIKRQAVEAMQRGDRFANLALRLPPTAADAGERYLAALDAADRYARAARLLTLAAPAAHRAFRQWYVGAIVAQVRALAAGEPAPPTPTFAEALAGEVDRLSGLEEVSRRLHLLQRVTSRLAGTDDLPGIAQVVVDSAVDEMGADTARVFVVDDAAGVLRSVALRGGGDPAVVHAYDEFAVDSDTPGAVVFRTRQALFLRSLAQIEATFPALAGYYPTERTLHVTPLVVGDHCVGVLSLTFRGLELDEEAQTAFVQALADALAQAIERAQAMHIAAVANTRLAFLADASVALSASLDFEATLTAVTHLMVPRLADWCVVQLMREGVLETLALLHFDPAKVTWAESMRDRYPVNMDAPTGGPVVVRTGVSEIYEHIPAELLEASAYDEDHLAILRELGMTSALVVPLTGRSGTFGVITLIYAESGRHYSADDLSFVEDVARRAALALETADTFREQLGRLADMTLVADAAQRAILAPLPDRLGPVALAARYVSAAAEAQVGGDLYEVLTRGDTVRLLIGDVRGKGLSAVRLATVVLGEFRAAAADVDALDEVARQIDRRVRSYLGDEDFVTALVAEVGGDGTFRIASCGHPPPLLASGDELREIALEPSVPLGLGADPAVASGRLRAGDRLLLYTDGAIEARLPDGGFVDLLTIAQPLATAPLGQALDRMLAALRQASGEDLGDDLALLAAQFQPEG